MDRDEFICKENDISSNLPLHHRVDLVADVYPSYSSVDFQKHDDEVVVSSWRSMSRRMSTRILSGGAPAQYGVAAGLSSSFSLVVVDFQHEDVVGVSS